MTGRDAGYLAVVALALVTSLRSTQAAVNGYPAPAAVGFLAALAAALVVHAVWGREAPADPVPDDPDDQGRDDWRSSR